MKFTAASKDHWRDWDDRTGEPRFAARAALLAHPTLAGIGEEGVHFAELSSDKFGLGRGRDVRKREERGQRAELRGAAR